MLDPRPTVTPPLPEHSLSNIVAYTHTGNLSVRGLYWARDRRGH